MAGSMCWVSVGCDRDDLTGECLVELESDLGSARCYTHLQKGIPSSGVNFP